MQHHCERLEGAPFTVENRGEGWYLYTGDTRGPSQINFCPCCGKPVKGTTVAGKVMKGGPKPDAISPSIERKGYGRVTDG